MRYCVPLVLPACNILILMPRLFTGNLRWCTVHYEVRITDQSAHYQNECSKRPSENGSGSTHPVSILARESTLPWLSSAGLTRPVFIANCDAVLLLYMSRDIQNQQSECMPSEDSDQSGYPPSLIRVFAVHMKKTWVLSYPLKTLIRLGVCPG